MMRFIMPIILIGIGITVFFVFSNPIYNEIAQLRQKVDSYDEALKNSKALENERDKLTAKYNSIDPANLLKLQKLLPENIDNIRLILEIEQIALPYGMILKDIKYNATETKKNVSGEAVVIAQKSETAQFPPKDYGIWDLEFSTTGTYNNFLNFTKDLENNLRIVDVSSIQFSSDTVSGAGSAPKSNLPESYKYDFKIKTYWLKN
ncbi:MAG: hypothetical protein US18_C0006G0012 [Parcubacteria group bacterium GW2011_GWB1_36_5]|nr:MAG: hypothetical protein US18_C0006G0012 [Parcubacteria group bacterium GW2011_GWB1_36_5]